MDPVTFTAGAIATLAFTKAFEKTVEKFTETALTKMDELRQKIWDKLRGNQKAEKALSAVDKGDKSQLERLAVYLQDAMEDDHTFAAEVQAIAQEINAGKLQDNSSMTQNNYDQVRAVQNKVEGGIVYSAAEMHIHQTPNSPS
ncbi:MAG: hypothetical protein F6K16_10285 [Symploca sp. SIO2B6]|nr:hypothetical protein [Symploca sp. SIO2B6]